MKTTEQTSRSTFADARMLSDGAFTTPQGNIVQTIYVDLAGQLPLDGLCLAKASEPRFDLRTTGSVRLSRPGVFRDTGEVLVKDEQEGRARTSTRETIEGPTGATAQMDRRVRAINAGLRLCHAKLSTSAVMRAEKARTATQHASPAASLPSSCPASSAGRAPAPIRDSEPLPRRAPPASRRCGTPCRRQPLQPPDRPAAPTPPARPP